MGVFIILIILCETGTYLATTPRATEHFFQFYILGGNGLLADYFPRGNPNLRAGVKVDWTIGVQNDMGNSQIIEVRVKVANQTIDSPNDLNYTASPAPELMRIDQALLNNETSEFPFVWSISNATSTKDSTQILAIQVNNQTYRISDWMAKKGYNFRLIFELWSLRTTSNEFVFDFGSDGGHRQAWLQVWFNATNTQQPPPPP